MEKLSLLSALILFGAFQGIILAIAINRIKEKNKSANKILAVFILLISLVLFSRLVYVEGVSIIKSYPRLYLVPDIPMFLYGPLFYFYMRSLLYKDKVRLKTMIPHFFPAILHLAIMSLYLFESREMYIQRLMQNDLIELPWAPYLAILQTGIYLVLSYNIYRDYLKQLSGYISYSHSLHHLKYIFLTVFICWLAWLYSSMGNFILQGFGSGFINYNLAWVALSFTTFFLAYFAIIQQDLFKMDLGLRIKYEKSTLTEKQLNIMEQKLNRFMKENKPYLDKKLTLDVLANRMQMHKKDLSRLINERFTMNFFDFVNSYRVSEFIERSREDEYKNMTVLAIAYDAGFNSKTTFNNVFKKTTTTTPSQFLKARQTD